MPRDTDAYTSRRWQFWFRRGSTFNDIVAQRPDGSLLTHKLLSNNPEQYPRCGGGGRSGTQISASHQTSLMMRLVSRGDITVVDAYLSPILRRYVDQVAAEMPGVKLFFMQSSGGLTDAQVFAVKAGKQLVVEARCRSRPWWPATHQTRPDMRCNRRGKSHGAKRCACSVVANGSTQP